MLQHLGGPTICVMTTQRFEHEPNKDRHIIPKYVAWETSDFS